MNRQQAQERFTKRITHALIFRLFLLQKLPLACIAGLRVEKLTTEHCSISIPYRWLTQNPFRSIYFAAQAMAAEMSTGILSMMAIQGCDPPLSMLVTNIEAVFLKKANARVYFTCADWVLISEAVEQAIKTNEGVTVRAKSTGILADGTPVAEFYITWSFKPKTIKH